METKLKATFVAKGNNVPLTVLEYIYSPPHEAVLAVALDCYGNISLYGLGDLKVDKSTTFSLVGVWRC